jgi:hypothetical protein
VFRIFILVAVIFISDAAVETRLEPWAAHDRQRRARAPLAADHPADARLPAQQRMHDHAEPGRAAVFAGFLVLELFFVELTGHALSGVRTAAACDQ